MSIVQAREHLRNPSWALTAAAELKIDLAKQAQEWKKLVQQYEADKLKLSSATTVTGTVTAELKSNSQADASKSATQAQSSEKQATNAANSTKV
jgi:hypothetical protein